MGKRRRILQPSLVVIIFGGLFFAVMRLRDTEPVYQGKPLSTWLAALDYSPAALKAGTIDAAKTAIEHMGTNAIPPLLRELDATDSPLKLKLVALAQKQHIIPIHYTPASTRQLRAFDALFQLGPQAEGAVPELLDIYEHNLSTFIKRRVPVLFGRIGPGAKAAIPLLVRLAGDTNQQARAASVFSLGEIREDPDVVVPALIKAMHGTDRLVRFVAIKSLQQFGPRAKAAFPALLELRKDPLKNTRITPPVNWRLEPSLWQHQIDTALALIDPQATEAAGVKVVLPPLLNPPNFRTEIVLPLVATRYRRQSAASSPPTPSSSASTFSTSSGLRATNRHTHCVGKKRRILLAVTIAAVLCGLLWAAFNRAEREPMYQGKSLSTWLYAPLTTSNPPQQQLDETQTAIRAMGTNAIPTLLCMLRRRDSPLVLKLVSLAQKQHLIAIQYVPPSSRYSRALMALGLLGTKAESAVPELVAIYNQNSSLVVQEGLPYVFCSIGPGAKAAIPSLLRKAATNTHDSVRAMAVAALGAIHNEADSVVPALIKAFQDPSAQVRQAAIYSVGAFGEKSKAAVPALLELHKDPSKNVQRGEYYDGDYVFGRQGSYSPGRSEIELVLKGIDPEAAAKVSAKKR